MKSFMYIYKLWSIHEKQWVRFVGTIKAETFEQAEWKISLKHPDYENLGELVGLIDQESGLKIDLDNLN